MWCWAQRIAVISYHKFPQCQWPAEEFTSRKVRLVNSEEVEIALAERAIRLSNGFWVREVRQLEPAGRQVAMLATDYRRGWALWRWRCSRGGVRKTISSPWAGAMVWTA